MNKIYQKKQNVEKNRSKTGFGGFTLIELLVVVLIIGVLTAVAISKYDKAVEKTRAGRITILVRAIADAEERYFMANGEYADDISGLDVQFPAGGDVMEISGRVIFSNGILVDNMTSPDSGGDIVGGYTGTEGNCYFRMFYDHSPYPGKITRGETSGVPNYYNIGTHPKCAQVCKSMGY